MRTLDLPRGKHCFMWDKFKVFDYIQVEKDAKDAPIEDGGVGIREATIIQNICWLHKLAPRVYDVGTIRFFDRFYIAQQVDVFKQKATTIEEAKAVYNKVIELGKEYGFENTRDDVSVDDVMDGRLVDFGTFRLTPDHKEKIIEIYKKKARYGKGLYQPVPEFSLVDAPRNSEQRINELGLHRLNFKSTKVLDLGCANGFFTRYAYEKGARKVVGIDHKSDENDDPIFANYLLSNELGMWGIHYKDVDLSQYKYYHNPFNIVFFLSMNFHIGIPKWLPQITKDVLIFEDNSKERNAYDTLKNMYTKVEKVGTATDHGEKPIYYCHKK